MKLIGSLTVSIILIFLLIPIVVTSQEINTYYQDLAVDIKETCHNNGSFCSSTASCNITIIDPKGNNIVALGFMTQHPSLAYFNYTVNGSSTNLIGFYRYDVTCGDEGLVDFGTFNFQVTSGGNSPTTADVLLYGLLYLGFAGLFLLTLWIYFRLDFKRKTDFNGMFTLKWEKYTKLYLLLLVYIEILFMLFVVWKTAETLVFLDFVSVLIYYFFISWLAIAAPMIIMVFIFTYVFVFTDKKLQKAVIRGVPFR